MSKGTVKIKILLVLVFLLETYGCGTGNVKTRLTSEDVNQLKSASHVYIVQHTTPAFSWWLDHIGFLALQSGQKKYSLIEAKEKLNLSFSPSLDDPTRTLKDEISGYMKEQLEFTNITSISEPFLDEDLMILKQEFGSGKIIDVKTNFWQLYPFRGHLILEDKSYEFQYSGIVRFIDLDTISVIHQRSCHYPSESIHLGQWLEPLNIDHSMKVSDLIENNGERINIQIHKAINHCMKEFQEIFPRTSLGD